MSDIKKFKIEDIQKVKSAEVHNGSIIDSDGNSVDFSDPRIVYVLPEPRNSYGIRLVKDLYASHNKNVRISKETNTSTLQYGKKICSGRECLACVAIAGEILKDIHENRSENEITIYITPIDQDGPCQNGAWPVIWKNFSKRLNLKNVLFYQIPNYYNNYLGLNKDFIAQEKLNFIIGQYIIEARNALRCTAEDEYSALNTFEEITTNFIESVRMGEKTIKTGLVRWAKEVAKIPLKAKVEETTKILIFGGLNLMFDHYPIEEFFLQKGIITKVADVSEGMTLLLSENTIRFGFSKGLLTPKDQFDEALINFSELNEKEQKEAVRAKRTKSMINFIDTQCKMYRRIMSRSGLLFDSYIEIDKLLEEGNKYVSSNSMTETPQIVGRFLYSLKENIYDGLINLGTFNCQPAMNSQAIIRPLANKSDVPYAAVDCEGPWLASNQIRLLETIAVQAKRLRKKKNELMKKSDNLL
ncbi:MAG: hypothetical protein EAX91_01210 [Candidatus Lokiarchaeota archaeon]|nr:hypothetical protein [Candidatus Lokiarchaeota archaeon]